MNALTRGYFLKKQSYNEPFEEPTQRSTYEQLQDNISVLIRDHRAMKISLVKVIDEVTWLRDRHAVALDKCKLKIEEQQVYINSQADVIHVLREELTEAQTAITKMGVMIDEDRETIQLLWDSPMAPGGQEVINTAYENFKKRSHELLMEQNKNSQ